MISTDVDFENIDLECKQTWALIGAGNTKGVFQLESRLGQSMAKRLKPSNIEELAALISIMRPGCLEAVRDNKTVSNHYIDKKNGLESVDYFHVSLEPILKGTYGEMVYQEQAMQICQQIANFDLSEADMLRKAIGKKNPEEMARIKTIFINKTKEANIVNEKESEQIFSWIEKSQRYSFNKSHAISYAMNAYVSAYCKAHYPHEFFVSYLKFAKDKIDPMREVNELINSANELGIDVYRPDIRKLNSDFILEDKTIYFGITNLKGVGLTVYNKIITLTQTHNIDISSMSLYESLFLILDNINSGAAKALVSVGALHHLKTSRKTILFYLDIIQNLSKREKDIIINDKVLDRPLSGILSYLKDKVNKKRKDIISSLCLAIDSPAYSLIDDPEWIANTEKQYMGIAITCSVVDSRDLEAANTDCRSLNQSGALPERIIVGAELSDISIVITKNGSNPGKEMAFIKLSDGTGSADVVVFPKEFEIYKDLLVLNNTIMISLTQSKKKDSYFIKKCWQI